MFNQGQINVFLKALVIIDYKMIRGREDHEINMFYGLVELGGQIYGLRAYASNAPRTLEIFKEALASNQRFFIKKARLRLADRRYSKGDSPNEIIVEDTTRFL
ncbi:hypothetical protein QR680_011508 [Steinernema hermaphroditum]|uniref:Uncharacterized protein n=1 Tax=Steinernema hermaphroditum TaxID=289476 RepID=A0AA39HYT2_9BILA|nr:hypothetical protein QR680_011508 [Steinernema hermaphroditum]